MYTHFPTRLFTGFLHRPLLRVFLFLFIFGTFFVVFLLLTHVHRLMNAPHLPGHYRPLSFDPPQPGSNRHRIMVERPITRPDAHRNKDIWARRADALRDAFLRAYNSYDTYASPYDELLPLSKAPMDTFNGWALSHIESLDTLWLMGL
ncbi:Glycoside hydrolase [Russula decolorans]